MVNSYNMHALSNCYGNNMKILLTLDLVQPVEPIVAALSALVDLSKADVKLLYVHEMLPAYENALRTSGNFSDDWEKQYDSKAHAMLAEAESLLKGKCKSVSSELATGPIAMTIEKIAKNEGHEMTVLVPRDQRGVKRFLSGGSVTSKVMQHAPGIVLILRNQPKSLSKVLVGHDGSDNAAYAIKTGAKVFRLSDAKVTLVHAVDIAEPIKLLGPVEFVGALEQNLLMQGEAILAAGEKLLADAGVKNIDLQLIEDDPAEGMITMANDSSADLVLIGAQGHTAVEHFLMGSVSNKIATHVACSVAVVKPVSPKK